MNECTTALESGIIQRIGVSDSLLRRPWWMLPAPVVAMVIPWLFGAWLPTAATQWLSYGILFLGWWVGVRVRVTQLCKAEAPLLVRARAYDVLMRKLSRALPLEVKHALHQLNVPLAGLLRTLPQEQRLTLSDRLLLLQSIADFVPRITQPVLAQPALSAQLAPAAVGQLALLRAGVLRVQERLAQAYALEANELTALLVGRSEEAGAQG